MDPASAQAEAARQARAETLAETQSEPEPKKRRGVGGLEVRAAAQEEALVGRSKEHPRFRESPGFRRPEQLRRRYKCSLLRVRGL